MSEQKLIKLRMIREDGKEAEVLVRRVVVVTPQGKEYEVAPTREGNARIAGNDKLMGL